MDVMISIRGLTKRFGPITAADEVSFDVRRGDVLGFLGPNGAGKSTTMKMVTGFLTPTAGTITVCGEDVARTPIPAKERIGYLPEGAPAYPDMTPRGFLNFVAEVRGYRGEERARRVRDAVETAHLGDVLHQPIDTLSKGFKRRVGFAQAILHDPEVLVLDEPTDGLDPNQKREVRALIRQMSRDKAIVLSTHILEEVEAVCTRAIIINCGRIVFDGAPAELQARSRMHRAVAIAVRGVDVDDLRVAMAEIPGVRAVENRPAGDGVAACVLFPEPDRSVMHEVGQRVHARSWEVEELREERGRLDEVFHALTTSDTDSVAERRLGGGA